MRKAHGPARRCKRCLLDLGYDLFIPEGNVLQPIGAEDIQDAWLADILAIPKERKTEILEKIRPREVRNLTSEERFSIIYRFGTYQEAPFHRTYSAWVLSERRRTDPELARLGSDLAEALKTDSDVAVAEAAQKWLG